MAQHFPLLEPAEPTEVLAALLAGGGLAWPVARSLAPWIEAVENVGRGEMFVLLEAARACVAGLLVWIDDAEARAAGLRSACAASFDLVEALDDRDVRLVEQRRASAWAALRALAADLRAARPSLWAKKHGLGW